MKLKVIIGLIFISLLTGCKSVDSEMSSYDGKTLYFKIISEEPYGNILYDTRTGVEYWMSKGYSHVLTILVDADGKPLIYDNNKESEDTE